MILLLACYSCTSKEPLATDINVSEIGSDSPDAFCRDFSLSPAQVSEFFEKAREVEVKEFHDDYLYLPCYVKGTLNIKGENCHYEVRAGGTGEVTCDDGAGYLFVCDSCDDLIGGAK